MLKCEGDMKHATRRDYWKIARKNSTRTTEHKPICYLGSVTPEFVLEIDKNLEKLAHNLEEPRKVKNLENSNITIIDNAFKIFLSNLYSKENTTTVRRKKSSRIGIKHCLSGSFEIASQQISLPEPKQITTKLHPVSDENLLCSIVSYK